MRRAARRWGRIAVEVLRGVFLGLLLSYSIFRLFLAAQPDGPLLRYAGY